MTDLHTFSQHLGLTNRLAGRQRRAILKRILVALCAGLAIFCALQAFLEPRAQTQVLLTRRDIPRGTHIKADMLKEVQLPVSPVFATVLRHPQDAIGLVATIDLEAGQPITKASLSHMPRLPQNSTSVRINLASAPEALLPGQFVKLVASAGCAQSTNDQTAHNAEHKPSGCIISSSALIMALPNKDQGTSGISGALLDKTPPHYTTFALPVQDAVTILSLPPETAIVAVHIDN